MRGRVGLSPAKGGPVWLAGSSQNKRVMSTLAMDGPVGRIQSLSSRAAKKEMGKEQETRNARLPRKTSSAMTRFQVELNPVTGASSIRDLPGGNRLAQHCLSLSNCKAAAGSHDEAHYIMALDDTLPGPLVGQRSAAAVSDRDGQLVARFVETLRLERGSRVLHRSELNRSARGRSVEFVLRGPVRVGYSDLIVAFT